MKNHFVYLCLFVFIINGCGGNSDKEVKPFDVTKELTEKLKGQYQTINGEKIVVAADGKTMFTRYIHKNSVNIEYDINDNDFDVKILNHYPAPFKNFDIPTDFPNFSLTEIEKETLRPLFENGAYSKKFVFPLKAHCSYEVSGELKRVSRIPKNIDPKKYGWELNDLLSSYPKISYLANFEFDESSSVQRSHSTVDKSRLKGPVEKIDQISELVNKKFPQKMLSELTLWYCENNEPSDIVNNTYYDNSTYSYVTGLKWPIEEISDDKLILASDILKTQSQNLPEENTYKKLKPKHYEFTELEKSIVSRKNITEIEVSELIKKHPFQIEMYSGGAISHDENNHGKHSVEDKKKFIKASVDLVSGQIRIQRDAEKDCSYNYLIKLDEYFLDFSLPSETNNVIAKIKKVTGQQNYKTLPPSGDATTNHCDINESLEKVEDNKLEINFYKSYYSGEYSFGIYLTIGTKDYRFSVID